MSKDKCPCKAFDNSFEFQHDNRKIVSIKDKGDRKYKYENISSNYLAKYKVENGLIFDNNNKKCDYLLLNCNHKKAYFIELKGSKLIDAIEQISRTIDELKTKLPDFSIFARIVITRFNTIELRNTSQYKELLRKVNKNKDGIIIKENILDEKK